MSAVIVACHTIEDELNLAIRETHVIYPVFWIDSKLHVKPENLREQVQGTISRITNVSAILLAFGCCGTGLVGIKSETAQLILPKVEDCISLLLGSEERRRTMARESASYFLTRGWLESENNLQTEYDYCMRKFGPERTVRVMRTMLKHYRHLTLIDTGGYNIDLYRRRTEELATTLGLSHQVVEGSQRFFRKLLLGPWDEEFIIARPGESITLDALLESNMQGQTREQTTGFSQLSQGQG